MNKITIGVLITISLFVFKTMDFSWVKGEITGYSKMCIDWSNDDDCLLYKAVEKDTFKVNASNQTVFELSKYGTDKYTKCIVVDEKNWECTYDDESARFGFARGKYFYRGIEFDYPSIYKAVQEYVGLSRFEWLIQKNIDSGCGRLNPICYLLN